MKKVILSLLMLSTRLYSAEVPALDSKSMASAQLSFRDMIFSEIKEKADRGDIESCLSYGSYLVGFVANPTDGKEKYAEGIAYLMKAADAGQGDACLMVGIAYEEGHYGVQIDKEKAKQYLQLAVDKKIANAYARLAQQLVSEDFTCDQPNVVVDLLEKSIAAEDLAGYYYYAILLREADFIESDLVRAFTYFKKASDEGDYSYADGMVAIMYQGGEGVAVNNLEAEKYYEKALAKDPDNTQYQFNFSQLLLNGLGRAPNLSYGRELLIKAADAGCSLSQRALGVRLLQGLGFDVDKTRALQYLNKAAGQGDLVAAMMSVLHGAS